MYFEPFLICFHATSKAAIIVPSRIALHEITVPDVCTRDGLVRVTGTQLHGQARRATSTWPTRSECAATFEPRGDFR